MTNPFLERTFQLISGVGPFRERDLWAQDIETWSDFEKAASSGVVMAASLDAALLSAIERARAAVAAGDLVLLAELVPPREHWRLFWQFSDRAAFFDIEADGDNVPTIVSVMDQQGLAVFRRDRSMNGLPERLARSPIWVTFNGLTFDVPVLKKTFATFPSAHVHIDLRFLVRKTKLSGGLKSIEEQLKLGRPPHLKGLRGNDAITLWRHWTIENNLGALRTLAEYNLYDTVNLRPILEQVVWRLAEQFRWNVNRPDTLFDRGDVLYDISKLVLEQ